MFFELFCRACLDVFVYRHKKSPPFYGGLFSGAGVFHIPGSGQGWVVVLGCPVFVLWVVLVGAFGLLPKKEMDNLYDILCASLHLYHVVGAC
jgi:hypothetical protein